MFILLEALRGRPVNKKWEVIINNVGAVLLISMMAFIIVNDVLNWGDRVEFLNQIKQKN